MYERFEELLRKRNVTATDVARDTGVPRSTFTDWKKGRSTPKLDKMVRIANYFGVPLEYLVGGEKSDYSIQLTNEELWLIGQYRQADDVTKAMLQRLLAYKERITK